MSNPGKLLENNPSGQTDSPSTPQAKVVDLVSTNHDVDDPLVAKQLAHPLAIWGLLLCRIENNRVVLPTFTDAFLDCFRQPKEEGNKRLLKNSLQDHADELAQLRDYLKRETVMPLLNASMSS